MQARNGREVGYVVRSFTKLHLLPMNLVIVPATLAFKPKGGVISFDMQQNFLID